MRMAEFPQVIVGTYEEFVLGYKPKNCEDNDKLKFTQIFATHSHQASVRCVAAHGQVMASSGADEYIIVYDMHAMEVSTVINYHNATVTCLEFTPDGSHLVTANQNGDIAIFRRRDWKLVKLWKEAHKHANGVTSISVHPSESLLMTTGADNIIRFWNLIKGRQAYATNFSKKCSVGHLLNFGLWSIEGDFFVVCIGNKVEVYKTEMAAIVYEIQTSGKATCAAFTKKNLICIGTEEGLLEIHSIKEKKLLLKEAIHKTRIKSVNYFSLPKNDESKIINYIVSTESKGSVKLWIIKKKDTKYSLKLKGEIDCECRITCLTTVFPKSVKKEKNELKESENSTTEEVLSDEVKNKTNSEDCLIFSSKTSPAKKNKKISENGNSNPGTNVSVINSRDKILEKKGVLKRRKSQSTTSFKSKNKLISPFNSPKLLKKRKLLNSSNSSKSPFKTKLGKWSVEDDS